MQAIEVSACAAASGVSTSAETRHELRNFRMDASFRGPPQQIT